MAKVSQQPNTKVDLVCLFNIRPALIVVRHLKFCDNSNDIARAGLVAAKPTHTPPQLEPGGRFQPEIQFTSLIDKPLAFLLLSGFEGEFSILVNACLMLSCFDGFILFNQFYIWLLHVRCYHRLGYFVATVLEAATTITRLTKCEQILDRTQVER